ncbi:alkaline phosphatase family protein [Neobacillus drentensis]|uniref:alkaline phosphatase family protein n=1 Tax=Neobacillus drentensis TaxID=220684 RepID=UPI0008263FAA|nr:alkaline phosphatase family protein [Neobacillus drentensis]
MLIKWGIALLSVLLFLSACAQDQSQEKDPSKEQNQSLKKEQSSIKELSLPTKTMKTKEGEFPEIGHIVIIVEENHSKKQIIGNKEAPYMNSLVAQGASLTNYHGTKHPSQPNYLDMFSGSNHGVLNNEVPKSKFSKANLGSELIEKNYTFTGYSEDLPSVGYNGEEMGDYVRKHNPWVNFTNLPKETNQPLKNFPKDFTQLSTVSMIVPNQQNNMHDGSIEKADQWLQQNIDSYVQWAKKNNSLLIITWDEDDGSEENKIPTFFVGPMVKMGEYNKELNHFNLLRSIEDIYGLTHAGKSNSVQPIAGIWK